MDNQNILEKAIIHYGDEHQLKKALEELNELSREIIKKLMGEKHNITEEIVDVEIMLEQVKMIQNISEGDIELIKHGKLIRLEDRMTKYICGTTKNLECSRCQPGACEHRRS